jgi:hypothetical protein
MCLDINWEEFNIQYWNGSAYVDFSAVYSKKADIVANEINFTTNTDLQRYWEFASISTTKIRIQITKTITANQEKTCSGLYIGREIGTFLDDPSSKPNDVSLSFEEGDKTITLSNMGVYQILSGKKVRIKFKFKMLGETTDLAIIQTMFALRECAILLCGADGTLYTVEGWRLQDIYSCVIKGDLTADHSVGRVKNIGYDFKFEAWEI